MKKKTKILLTLVFTLLFITSFAVFSFAKEEAAEEANVFSELYRTAADNADKIFSLLAFVGALALTFAYKKGLFPFVEKALASLAKSVGALKEEADKSNTGVNNFIEDLTKKLALSENVLKEYGEKLKALEKKLDEANLLNDKTQELRCVLTAEVEMIYEIFANSSLPEYQKEKVGEAYLKMKRALAEKEA
jgi:hypothetical protein